LGIPLKNKPLVEAILELKWQLADQGQGMVSDPNYRVLLGRFSERVEGDYPAYERLDLAGVPDELVGHQPQHRFRASADSWPLVQLGPGILTVNDTETYDWDDYEPRCARAISLFLDAYPGSATPQVQDLTLRYMDAIPFDFRQANVLEFLEKNLKAKLGLPSNLFEGMPVKAAPASTSWTASFPLQEPEGTITVRFSTGFRNQEPALIWETLVMSDAAQAPDLAEGFAKWLSAAHTLTDDWFFKLIEGDLLRRFKGE
jgi:hypothetical protein